MMRKLVNGWFAVMTILLLSGVLVQAQVYDFENYNVGDAISAIGWGGMVAEVADDPLAAGNKVLKFTPNNYNAAPVLEFTLPAGKTLADYPTFKFKAYFAQGDVGWKDIVVEAYQTAPTAQAYNNAAAKIGSWNRATGAGTTWEDITIDIAGSAAMTGTIYIAFGINCAGTGSGATTIWYADDLDLGIGEEPPPEGLVSKWGKTSLGTAWPILNTEATPEGDAGIGDGAVPTNWSTIRGEFATLEATTSQAVVVSGQLEFVGGGCADHYTHLRYALTFQDSTTLNYQYTDSAMWESPKKHDGYGFHPRTGNGTMSNGNGGAGTLWTINDGNWNSTWSNNGLPIAAIKQAPRNAVMDVGLYNWAISVHPLGDGTNEVRWYMVEQNNKYWFGGTVIDTAGVTTKFNGVCFGFNKDLEATQVNLFKVKAELGAPIDVPEAPWEPFYITEWGKTSLGTAWPILNDSLYLDGDASIGDGAVPTNWATIRGGFEDPVYPTTKRAIIVSGQLEFVGGGCASAYTHLRYALTFQDSTTLKYQYTDSAMWESPKKHDGYGFHPRTGNGTMSNGNGGAGVVWTINNGNWTSTWSNNGLPISAVKQAPRNAVMDVGLYNWAISVQPLGDGTNEVRWYMVEQNNKYWFGGTVIDTAGVTNKINGVCFGFNKDLEATQVNLYAVMVDLGDPIEIPEAPWEPFYVTQWGKTSLGTAWPVLNDSTYLDGDASIGDGAIPTNWSTIRGGFEDPVQATTKKAVIVSGQLEFVGGGCASAYTHLRYALTFQDSATLKYQYTDSAMWESPKKHYGWGFHPRTGNGTMSNGNGGAGVVWTIKDGNWTSTWSNNGLPISAVKQAPRNAVMDVGLYNWAISIQPLGDGTVEVRWYMIEQNNKYWFGGTVIDTAGVTTKVNGVCFGFNKDLEATQVNLYAVMVDMGDPIEVPEPPWEPFYLTDWGFSGGNLGGWDLTLGDFDGDVTIGGTAAPTGWSAVRGGFGDPYILTPEPNRALLVTGKIELVGGGFEDLGSLRYGVFYSDSAGTTKQDADLDSNWVWTGSDGYHSGYLFVPTSGMNITSWSGQPGSWGAIDNSTWWDINAAPNYPLGSSLQEPANAIAGPGTYDFAISVSPTQTGNSVKATLSKTDKSYYWEVSGITAVAATTDRFNCVAFAINNSTTTTMNLIEVQVDRGAHITTDVQVEEIRQLPTIYSLNQNYPNPFNPTTTIEFALPQRSEVTLVVYDALGRVVAELANGYLNAGYYEMNFDARNLASGVYFVRLKAGDFVSVKKAMLLK